MTVSVLMLPLSILRTQSLALGETVIELSYGCTGRDCLAKGERGPSPLVADDHHPKSDDS